MRYYNIRHTVTFHVKEHAGLRIACKDLALGLKPHVIKHRFHKKSPIPIEQRAILDTATLVEFARNNLAIVY